jgi:hypothetical protein
MMMSFMAMESRESYMHYYAKEIVRSWFVSATKYNREHGYANKLYIFSWSPEYATTGQGDYGVRLEYPILSTPHTLVGVDPCWADYPALDQLGTDVDVTAILDIAILDGGRLRYGIEIVHKHICSSKKRESLCAIPGLTVYELSAEWVLSQIRHTGSAGNIVPPARWPLVPLAPLS